MNTTTLDELNKETLEFLESVDLATNEDLDLGLGVYGKNVIHAYKYKLLTDSQRKKLSDYVIRKQAIKSEISDKLMSEQLSIMENSGYVEQPTIHQRGVIEDRIVVASVTTYMENKVEKQKANGGVILEIYKDRHPKSYEYAKKHYSIAAKLEQ